MNAALPPGFLIAAPRSGSGKTTLSLGLLRAFTRQDLAVAAMKCGPDYIDPSFHEAACGRPSVNLDSWAMNADLIASLAIQTTKDVDLAIGEGLMGLFDGVPAHQGRSGSTADIAAALGWPVLLVLDISGQSQSAAAIAKGFATFDPRIKIGGVVLNRVGSPRHRRLVTDSIEALDIPVVGSLPRSTEIALPERHLGLVQASETDGLDARLDRLADFVAEHVDLDAVRRLALSTDLSPPAESVRLAPPGQRIAIARDAAFSFLYPHILHGWRQAGAEIAFFSPLADEGPRGDCDACWLPGGYPELHAGELAAAHSFQNGLRRFGAAKPVHGECGGYMALGKTLLDQAGKTHEMAGLLDVTTSFATRRMTLGYRQATIPAASVFGPGETRLRGHEFHYATILDEGRDDPFAFVTDVHGALPARAGSRRGLVTGSFFHAIAAYNEEKS